MVGLAEVPVATSVGGHLQKLPVIVGTALDPLPHGWPATRHGERKLLLASVACIPLCGVVFFGGGQGNVRMPAQGVLPSLDVHQYARQLVGTALEA